MYLYNIMLFFAYSYFLCSIYVRNNNLIIYMKTLLLWSRRERLSGPAALVLFAREAPRSAAAVIGVDWLWCSAESISRLND